MVSPDFVSVSGCVCDVEADSPAHAFLNLPENLLRVVARASVLILQRTLPESVLLVNLQGEAVVVVIVDVGLSRRRGSWRRRQGACADGDVVVVESWDFFGGGFGVGAGEGRGVGFWEEIEAH